MFQVVLNPTCYLAQVPKANRRTANASTSTTKTRLLISHAQYQALDPHLRVVSSILKDICDPISMKTHINDIGLDHMGKGFRDNMIVNDIMMNSCIVIFDRLNVRGVGNCLRGWMR